MTPSESTIVRSSKFTVSGRAGTVPAGDDDALGGDRQLGTALVTHAQRVRVGERRGAGQQADPVAGELAADDVDLAADDVLGPGGQVGHRDVLLEAVALPVQLALVEPGQVQHRLAQRLRRNGAGVDAHPADHVPPLHQRDPPAQLGRRDGRPSARPARIPPPVRRSRTRAQCGNDPVEPVSLGRAGVRVNKGPLLYGFR
jgi:hypothetical protein